LPFSRHCTRRLVLARAAGIRAVAVWPSTFSFRRHVLARSAVASGRAQAPPRQTQTRADHARIAGSHEGAQSSADGFGARPVRICIRILVSVFGLQRVARHVRAADAGAAGERAQQRRGDARVAPQVDGRAARGW
jgi:hypothetical protein